MGMAPLGWEKFSHSSPGKPGWENFAPLLPLICRTYISTSSHKPFSIGPNPSRKRKIKLARSLLIYRGNYL